MAIELSSGFSADVAQAPKNRLVGYAAALVRFAARAIDALKIPAPETALQIRRIQIMEREIMLPIKAVGILMIYSFYLTSWTGYAHTALEVDIEAVITFFWIYVLVNIVFAALLLRMKHLPPA